MKVLVTIMAFLAPTLPPGQVAVNFYTTPPKYCTLYSGEHLTVPVSLDTGGVKISSVRVILVIPAGNVVRHWEGQCSTGRITEDSSEERDDGSVWVRLRWVPDKPVAVSGYSPFWAHMKAITPGLTQVTARMVEIKDEHGVSLAKTVTHPTRIRVQERTE